MEIATGKQFDLQATLQESAWLKDHVGVIANYLHYIFANDID